VNGSAGSQTLTGSGTYSVNNNCSLSLTFATPVPGTSGALTPPAAFTTLLGVGSSNSTYNGLITVQPASGVISPGVVISQ
jgi:hypothetical protein